MGKPSVHIQPVDMSKWFVGLPTMKKGGLQSIFRRNNDSLWIYPFDDNGGSLPHNQQELFSDISRSLEDSSYCSDNAKRFIADKIFNPDGKTCERIIADVKDWAQ
jgi:hypothetical protein